MGLSAEAKTTALSITKALAAMYETIVESGSQGCPEGPLYAAMMTVGMDLELFERVIDGWVKADLVRRTNHVLYAVQTK